VLGPVSETLQGEASGADLGLRFVAHKRYREGSYAEALNLFEQVVASPESVHDLVDALRMKAQINAFLGSDDVARSTYELMIAVLDESDTAHTFALQYTNAVGWLAHLERMNGQPDRGVQLLLRITDDPDLPMSFGERTEYIHQLALAQAEANDLDGAAATYDRLRQRLAALPPDPNARVWLFLERATVLGADRNADAFRLELTELLFDPEVSADPVVVQVANEFLASVAPLTDVERHDWRDVLDMIGTVVSVQVDAVPEGVDAEATAALAFFFLAEADMAAGDVASANVAYEQVVQLQPLEPIGQASQETMDVIDDPVIDPCDDGDPTGS